MWESIVRKNSVKRPKKVFNANNLLTDWLTDQYKNSDWLMIDWSSITKNWYWIWKDNVLDKIDTENNAEMDALIDVQIDTGSDTGVYADLESRQASLYSFLMPASLLQNLFFFKTPFPKSKIPPYLSYPFLPARLQMLHRLPNCPSKVETGFCLLIARDSAKFLFQYSSHLNLVSFFAIPKKMSSRLLTLLQ